MARHRRRVVEVRVELLDSESGHWCTRCALPSGWLLWFVVRFDTRMHLERHRWCDECDRGDAIVLGEG